MARILAYTSPARGHLYPLTSILDELCARGHDIILRTLASQLELARSRGFDAAPIDNRIEAMPHDDYKARTARGGLQRAVSMFSARAEYDGPDLQQAIESTRPDAVIVDVNCWGAVAAAEAWGGPWATFCPYPLALTSRDAPPFGPGLPPARGLLGRMRDRALKPLFVGTFERTMLPPLNEVRLSFKLDPVSSADDMFGRPPLLLYLTAEPFEYPRSDWPSNIVMVGPCAWDPPAEPPEWLAKIERPIVLVTTSSEFQNDGRLIEAALDALSNENVHIIATLPAQDSAAFRTPANVSLFPFLPHGLILDRAVCAITHGGMGATQKALVHGVPVCAVPFGRDQLEVARRVEVAGAGTRLPASRLSPDRLRTKVREAMACVEGARRISEGFALAGGPSAAAAAFEKRLLRRPSD
ncbi:glycosyltransferase [Cohnella nanjingensis]|uniref:Glycosyltransferase family 1 protein n=1 Tax=Cohnella nanjingensis TaxID=1387779 RepID=A0A7X0RTF4_9BACL|nr:glycosyltransferase [Cohnella nanjingensis]MBB6671869.1 glycosyltransferase family 1 protein [Cohnella nanjingensis]